MASLKADKVQKSLLKKGFVKSDRDHHFFEFYKDGKLVVMTKTSHNGQDIGDSLIGAMSKQCKMDKQFFKDFVKCTKSQDDYEDHLKSKNFI